MLALCRPEPRYDRDLCHRLQRRAEGSRPRKLDWRLAPPGSWAGGVLMTARDVERYFQVLLNGGSFGGTRVLSPESVEEMWTPSFRISESISVGLGWIAEEVRGQQAMMWIGGTGTSGSIFMLLPDRGLAIAVLDNYDSAEMHNLAKDIVSIALGDEPCPQTGRSCQRSSRIAARGTAMSDCTSAHGALSL